MNYEIYPYPFLHQPLLVLARVRDKQLTLDYLRSIEYVPKFSSHVFPLVRSGRVLVVGVVGETLHKQSGGLYITTLLSAELKSKLYF